MRTSDPDPPPTPAPSNATAKPSGFAEEYYAYLIALTNFAVEKSGDPELRRRVMAVNEEWLRNYGALKAASGHRLDALEERVFEGEKRVLAAQAKVLEYQKALLNFSKAQVAFNRSGREIEALLDEDRLDGLREVLGKFGPADDPTGSLVKIKDSLKSNAQFVKEANIAMNQADASTHALKKHMVRAERTAQWRYRWMRIRQRAGVFAFWLLISVCVLSLLQTASGDGVDFIFESHNLVHYISGIILTLLGIWVERKFVRPRLEARRSKVLSETIKQLMISESRFMCLGPILKAQLEDCARTFKNTMDLQSTSFSTLDPLDPKTWGVSESDPGDERSSDAPLKAACPTPHRGTCAEEGEI